MSFEEHWSFAAAMPDAALIKEAALALAEELGLTSDWRALDVGGGWSIDVPVADIPARCLRHPSPPVCLLP